MIKRIALAVLFASALLVGLSAQAQEKSSGVLLTAEDLKKLLDPSLLMAGTSVQFASYFAYLFVRGGVVYDVYTNDAGIGGPEKSKWRLDGDKICFTVEAHLDERCRHWYRLADGSYEGREVLGGKLQVTFRVINKPQASAEGNWRPKRIRKIAREVGAGVSVVQRVRTRATEP